MPKRCTRCQKELTSGQIICLECATELKTPTKTYFLNYGGYKIGNWHCDNCNGIVEKGDTYCKHCGRKLDWSDE